MVEKLQKNLNELKTASQKVKSKRKTTKAKKF